MLRNNIILLIILLTSCSDNNKIKPGSIDLHCQQDAQNTEITPEICDDEIDNNCDGNIDIADITCACRPGETNNKCWPTDNIPVESVLVNINLGPGSRLYGKCEYGTQICRALPDGGSEWGNWDRGIDNIGGTEDDIWMVDSCIGAILPEEEQCDDADNNCNGRIDESLKIECWSGLVDETDRPARWIHFYNSETNPDGVCKTGIRICEQGTWSQCLYEVLPQPEICDAVDNDCDGIVDNNLIDDMMPCGLTDVGLCSYGYMICEQDTADMVCQEYRNPEEESCNGLDDDCDGTTDEDLFRPCSSTCESGFEVCEAGSYKNCSARLASEEVCDSEDNDCDGIIDEDIECPCPPELENALIPCIGGAMICGFGYKTCIEQNDELVMTECCALETYIRQEPFNCIGGLGNTLPEECNNYDDDCDSLIDEDLLAECYAGQQETKNVGECHTGQVICNNGRWGNISNEVFIDELCLNQVLPEEEVCNGRDDDCDSLIDEDLNTHDKVDLVFILDDSGSMCQYVAALTQGYSSYVLDFINTEHKFAILEVGAINNRTPGTYRITDFIGAQEIVQVLISWQCDNHNIEPTYDAVRDAAINNLLPENLSFRNDAFPMFVLLSDEVAQSIYIPPLAAEDVVSALIPCRIGNCGQVEKLEVYAIVPDRMHTEWCAPSNIAKQCYDLYSGIDGETIRQYLEDIFSDICR